MSDAVFVQVEVTGELALLQQCMAEHFADGKFDYNSVIAMPPELDIEESSSVTTGYDALYGNWTEPAKYWTWKEAAASLGLPFPLQSREELLACIRSLDCAEMYLGPARRYKENMDRYGHGSWHGWRAKHWGSKWNSEGSNATVDDHRILLTFTAANSFPKPVIVALSQRWSGLEFRVLYADEHGRWGRDFRLRNGKEFAKTKHAPGEILAMLQKMP